VLSTELLEASQRRVNVREGLLNGLLPRHLVPSVVKCIQAAEHDAELLRVQSELLAGPLRDSRGLSSAQRGHDDEDKRKKSSEGLQSAGAARSIFDGEPRFIEIWDNLVVVAVRFSLPIPMALDEDDVTIGTAVRSRRETDETHRSLHDTIESLRAIDACLQMLTMRVIRVVGDTVMIAAIPAKSNAPDTPPLPFASDVPSEQDKQQCGRRRREAVVSRDQRGVLCTSLGAPHSRSILGSDLGRRRIRDGLRQHDAASGHGRRRALP
jgi:hypothetical protein